VEIMQLLGAFALVFALSLLVEALVEAAFGKPVEWVKAVAPYKESVLLYIAFAAGILGAFTYQFDLMFFMGEFVEYPVALTPFGMVLTGLAIGRGSNFVHAFYQRMLNYKAPVSA
jgi:hypothetical protein